MRTWSSRVRVATPSPAVVESGEAGDAVEVGGDPARGRAWKPSQRSGPRSRPGRRRAAPRSRRDARRRAVGQDRPLLGHVLARRHAVGAGADAVVHGGSSRSHCPLERPLRPLSRIWNAGGGGRVPGRGPRELRKREKDHYLLAALPLVAWVGRETGPKESSRCPPSPLRATCRAPCPRRPALTAGRARRRADRQYAAARPFRSDRPAGGTAARQGGVRQSRRLGQGPSGVFPWSSTPQRRGLFEGGRRLLDATSGNTGIAYAMIGAALRHPGDALPAGEREPGAQAHPAGLWRRAAADRSAGGQRRRHPGSAAAGRRGAGALGLPRPVLQPGELARPLPHHRAGDLGADRRRRHPLRHRPRHQRYLHGSRAVPAGEERSWEAGPADLGGARLALPRPGRDEAHGLGHRAADLRPRARRRGARGLRPRGPTRW